MGFLKALKTIKNTITGGGAEVYFEYSQILRGETFELTVRANVKDNDLNINRVYFEIEGIEEVNVPDIDVAYERDGDLEVTREIVNRTTCTMQQEFTLTDPEVLEANQGYEWNFVLEFPEDALPTYEGQHCRHHYVARASLDAFGNDPDSGWISLNVE